MLLPEKINLYLNKKTSDTWKIEREYPELFKKIIVVPAIAESKNIPVIINSLEKNDESELFSTLLLIVVNNSISSTEEVKKDNLKTLDYLKKVKTKLNISFIDASTAGKELDDKNAGVGLARKIGMDLALTKFDYQYPHKNILICTDADCIVESNYLLEISKEFSENNYDAAITNFAHNISGNDEETKAIICYEIFLRYYVWGLTVANSNYAFPTVGSTMLCTPEAYVKVEGMNKRKAAEDFYFLEKLAKIYKIGKINSTTVYPSKRSSWRVPFGTGRSVDRFLTKDKNEYQLYNPIIFTLLKNWLEVFFDKSNFDYPILIDKVTVINPALAEFLEGQKLKEFFNNSLKQNLTDAQILKQKHYWFDAFRTLKLIHYFRDILYPNINMFDALDVMFGAAGIENKIKRNSDIPDLETQKEYLSTLRKIQS